MSGHGEQRPFAEASHELLQRLMEGVPEELQAYPHFVVWKYIPNGERMTKPPINPITGHFADPTDPQTWGTFHQALRALSSGRFHGVGFVFAEDDPFTGTDLDHCVQADGTLEPWAQDIVTALDSYTEYSPSGNGLHVLTKATLPGRKVGSVEMYSEKRFFTLTGNHYADTPLAVLDRQEEQERQYNALTPADPTNCVLMTPQKEYAVMRTRRDDEVLEKAMHARNGASFTQLWQGSTAGFRSKSEADFTLVLRLLYWTNDDIEQTKRLFRQSGLYDPQKTEKPRGEGTYLDITIQNAMKKRRR